jgi:hypothetical protein
VLEKSSLRIESCTVEVGDCAGAKVADTLTPSFGNGHLILNYCCGGIDSIAQVRPRDEGDANIWLRGMHFVERNIVDPEDPRTTGVAWLRCPLECLRRQFGKAGEEYVHYNLFMEVDRAGQRVYNHPLGCKLADEATERIKVTVMRIQSGAWHTGFPSSARCMSIPTNRPRP